MTSKWCVLFCLLGVSGMTCSMAADLYVWTNSPHPATPYNAWTNAAHDIQSAVSSAVDGDTVWVTNGVYRTGGWAAHGTMTSRVAVLLSVTVRSINGPDYTVIEGQGPIGDAAIRGVYLHTNAALIGFTVSNGHTRASGDWFYEQSGGGIACQRKSAIISNCIVRNCEAGDSGGGIADGTVYNSEIMHNTASTEGGGVFALYLYDSLVASNYCGNLGGGSGSSLLVDSRIVGNTGYNGGGGVYSGILSNCVVEANQGIACGGVREATAWWTLIIGNHARDGAGAMKSSLYYCDLIDNVAQEWGGGAYDCGGSYYGVPPQTRRMENCFVAGNRAELGGGAYDCTLLNCTVVDNEAETGGGMYTGFATNSILYYNRAFTGSSNYYDGYLGNCCTAPLPSGTGNMADRPKLTGLRNPHLLTNSPCRDVGLTLAAAGTVDVDDEPRVLEGDLDIGCDEVYISGLTGSLSIAISVPSPIVSTGYPVDVEAVISGRITRLQWNWGDGSTTDNDALASHQYSATGTWWVVLTVWNQSGSATAQSPVTVVDYQTTYASLAGGDVYPYTSWANAATTIQAAVDAAPVGGEVRVAAGDYNLGERLYRGMNHRLVVDKPLKLVAENPGVFETVIRGAGPVGPGAVRCAYLSAGSHLDGFTLADGATISNTMYLATWETCSGGGAVCEDGAVLSNCWIAGNRAARGGGGLLGGSAWNSCLANNHSAQYGGGSRCSDLHGCEVVSNYAGISGGGLIRGTAWDCVFRTNQCSSSGGGLYESVASNCLLIANEAGGGGGAGNSTLTACVFSNNTAEIGGGSASCIVFDSWYQGNIAQDRGSMYSSGNAGAIYKGTNVNCVITENTAEHYGGGCYETELRHCVVVGNLAGEGYGGGGVYDGAVYNSIIYYNFCTNAWYDSTNAWGPFIMEYSCCNKTNVNGGDYQTNNIALAPQFVNAAMLDFSLMATSPCVDAGDPSASADRDLDGVARPLDGDANGEAIVDMGAYEYASSLADTDGDRMTDYGEVLAGTNPRDDQSYLRLAALEPSALPNSFDVRWASESGRRYNLTVATNLLSDPFGLVALTNVMATPPTNSFNLPRNPEWVNAYYRIELAQ